MFYYNYSGQADTQSHSKSMDRLLTHLRNDLKALVVQWQLLGRVSDISYQDRVSQIYAK